MTLEQQIKALRGNSTFETIYNKYKQKRHRDKSISLRRCRELALSEYYLLLQRLKTEGNVSAPEETELEEDYYVMVGGKSMLNSEWKRLLAEQKRCGDTKVFPSRDPESYGTEYLKSLFRNDKNPPRKSKAVDLWKKT